MRIIVSFLFFIMNFISMTISGQEKNLFLVHNKSNKVLIIKKNSAIVLKTIDGQKTRGQLTAIDSMNLYLQTNKKIISKIPIENIGLLKKDLLNNKKWTEPFAYTITIGLISLIITPIVWAFEGNKEALGTLELSGAMAAISTPALLVSLSKRKFNIEKDWRIEIRE
ncbi:hypothetical protein SLW70_09790 [Flavobacterium sp. NG2]|uniref:hypothetical protein n=1 Tax=Flavobacterium sp. NG2 TaxID=3097547 RepID=UPI002A81C5B9|nr:hypothetical protein [Flavobacterium sp. NG2]WPR70236.1 hypothetical protein SLW70_09790 [Flavobacterium sp. NG2]